MDVGTAEVGLLEVGGEEVGLLEVSADEVGLLEVGGEEVGPAALFAPSFDPLFMVREDVFQFFLGALAVLRLCGGRQSGIPPPDQS